MEWSKEQKKVRKKKERKKEEERNKEEGRKKERGDKSNLIQISKFHSSEEILLVFSCVALQKMFYA